MVKTTVVDTREFARFFVTGVTSTVGNIAAVWSARLVMPYEIALLVGLAAGLTISFVLTKLFAFSSRSRERVGGEMVRFLVVYAVGCAVYWAVAIMCARFAVVRGFAPGTAELAGILFGGSTMTLTSYLGHRFFTYRTYQRGVQRLGHTS